MKILTFLTVFIIGCQLFGQKLSKEKIVLEFDKKENELFSRYNFFRINDVDFRYVEEKHTKQIVNVNDILDQIITIESLKQKTTKKLEEQNQKDNFIQRYFDQFFDIYIFKIDTKDKNSGVLYQVEWIVTVTDPEID